MIVIELRWPPKQVWPNWRQSHHWRSYAPHVANQRLYAKWATREVTGPSAPVFDDERIPIHVEFYPPDRRPRDDDGLVGAFKSARDGIADALGVDDKRFKATYWTMPPSKPGNIVVRIGAKE